MLRVYMLPTAFKMKLELDGIRELRLEELSEGDGKGVKCPILHTVKYSPYKW